MAESGVSAGRVCFGPFELNARTGELWKGRTRLPVPDQSVEVLKALLERPGDLVTREELRERLWPADTFVDFERGLNGIVRRLRDALGDSADTPAFIETLPRRGYRFIGDIEAAPAVAEAKPARARRRRTVPGAAAALLLVAAFAAYRGWSAPERLPVSLAVLPFHVAAGAEDLGFLGVGLPDTIISRLALVHGVRVRPTRAVLTFRGTAGGARGAGQRLAVDYVLTGTVTREAEQFRVTPQLIRVADGVPLWTRVYTRSDGDLLGLHDEIARAVVAALAIQTASAERARVDRTHTRDPEAYALYVRARAQLARDDPEGAAAAFELFNAALGRDREYAAAYAGAAAASAQRRLFFATEADIATWETRAHEAARRALQL